MQTTTTTKSGTRTRGAAAKATPQDATKKAEQAAKAAADKAAKQAKAQADHEATKAALQADRDRRKAEREAKKNAPKPNCECGCGAQTKGGRFLPGHDARLHSRVKSLRETGLCSGTVEEIAAAQAALAAGHFPEHGSLAPRFDQAKGEKAPVKPRASQEKLGQRICQLQKLLAQLEAEYEVAIKAA